MPTAPLVTDTVDRRPATDERLRQASPRLEFVDGLRGFACLYVVVYHFFLLWPVAPDGSASVAFLPLQLLVKFAAFGHIGVNIFLALSGFCLFYPICRRAAGRSHMLPPLKVKEYARRRARRILPAYLAVVVVCSVLPLWTVWAAYVYPFPTPAEFLTHLALIHNLLPSTVLTVNSSLWSLGLEAQLYILFPVLIVLFRRTGPIRFSVIVFVGCLAFRLVAWYRLGGESMPWPSQFALMNSLPGRFFEFGMGMLAAYVLTRTWTRWERRAVCMTAVVTVLGGVYMGYTADKTGVISPFADVGWGFLAFGLILGGSELGVRPLRVFRGRWLVSIGLFSYSIYLLQEPLLRLSGGLARDAGLGPLPAVAVFALLVGPAMIALSYALFLGLERPFLRTPPNVQIAATSMAALPQQKRPASPV
jgi:peptidoglycan/LPS O-acetylase OafA/YrhL